MNQQQTEKVTVTNVKPWTVLCVQNGKKRIIQRYKKMYDAQCYANQLQQSNPTVVYQVQFLSNQSPNGN